MRVDLFSPASSFLACSFSFPVRSSEMVSGSREAWLSTFRSGFFVRISLRALRSGFLDNYRPRDLSPCEGEAVPEHLNLKTCGEIDEAEDLGANSPEPT